MSNHQNRWRPSGPADNLDPYSERVDSVAGDRQSHRTTAAHVLMVAATPATGPNHTVFAASLEPEAGADEAIDRIRWLIVMVLAQLVVLVGVLLGAVDPVVALVVVVTQLAAGLWSIWRALPATGGRR